MFAVHIINNEFRQLIRRSIVALNATHKVPAICNNSLSVTTSRHYSNKDSFTANSDYRNISKDRTIGVPVETSINYLKSDAYKQTYGDEPVWLQYRRNHKGALPPRKTRRTCIRKNTISTGNPCPVCRDEYLVLNETNTQLLKQFISPHTGAILSYQETGLCQKRHQELMISVDRARDRGLLTFDIPFRKYNYSDYYK